MDKQSLIDPRRTVEVEAEDPDRDNCLTRGVLITSSRGEKRGHPIENMERYRKFLEIIFGREVTLTQAVLTMHALKMSRELARHDRDNVDDLAGWTWVLEAVQKKEGIW